MADQYVDRVWVTRRSLAALDDAQRRKWDLLLRAYVEEASLGRAKNPLTPELSPYRQLFRTNVVE
jgi:hypothetical protein